MNLQKDLREFIELLSVLDVRFVIVAALTVAYHGYFRYTSDIDLFVDSDPENAKRILRAIEQFGFADLKLTVDGFSEGQVFQLGVAPNRIDLLTILSGVSFHEAWVSREQSELDGVSVSLISRDLLKQNNRACGRLRDLADLEYL
jgi:hypothetical protein